MLRRIVAGFLAPILALLLALSARATPLALDADSSRLGFELDPSGRLVSPIGQQVQLSPSKPFTLLKAEFDAKEFCWVLRLSNQSGDRATARFHLNDFTLKIEEQRKGRAMATRTYGADPKLVDTLRIWSVGVDPTPMTGQVAELDSRTRSLSIIDLPSRKVADSTDSEHCSWAVVSPGYFQHSRRSPLADLVMSFLRVDPQVMP